MQIHVDDTVPISMIKMYDDEVGGYCAESVSCWRVNRETLRTPIGDVQCREVATRRCPHFPL
jgi:hypothetical protein